MNNLFKKLFSRFRLQKEIVHHNDLGVKVIGIGGCGGNVVGYLYSKHGDDVDCIYCDRDAEAIDNSLLPVKILIKENVEDSSDDIRSIFSQKTNVVFIVVGIGGRTGATVVRFIVKICRELGIPTVLIAVTPFSFEGARKEINAFEIIKEMSSEVDFEMIYSNNYLFSKYGKSSITGAFDMCSESICKMVMNISKLYYE